MVSKLLITVLAGRIRKIKGIIGHRSIATSIKIAVLLCKLGASLARKWYDMLTFGSRADVPLKAVSVPAASP
jgi:hypothetical protein